MLNACCGGHLLQTLLKRYQNNDGNYSDKVNLSDSREGISTTGNDDNYGNIPEHMQNIQLGDGIILTVDSMYVVRLLKGQCKANENQLLVDLMLHLWRFVGKDFALKVKWSPGHNNPKKGFKQLAGTGIVDDLASNVGTNKHCSDDWWKRPYTLSDWGERAFVCKLHGQNAAKRQKTGVSIETTLDDAPPTDVMNIIDADKLPALHPRSRQAVDGHEVTTISGITQSIADAAMICGKPTAKFTRRLPRDDPDRIEL